MSHNVDIGRGIFFDPWFFKRKKEEIMIVRVFFILKKFGVQKLVMS
jgi:hypothetical protein